MTAISKEQTQAIKSALKAIRVGSEVLADKVQANKAGVWTFWKKSPEGSTDIPPYNCEAYGKTVCQELGRSIPELNMTILETDWNAETWTHVLKATFAPNADEAEAIAPTPAPEPEAKVEAEAEAKPEPKAKKEKEPEIFPELIRFNPELDNAWNVYAQVAELIGGESDLGGFKGSIRSGISDAAEVEAIAVGIYKAVRLYCQTVSCTYRLRRDGKYTISLAAGARRPVEVPVEVPVAEPVTEPVAEPIAA